MSLEKGEQGRDMVERERERERENERKNGRVRCAEIRERQRDQGRRQRKTIDRNIHLPTGGSMLRQNVLHNAGGVPTDPGLQR